MKTTERPERPGWPRWPWWLRTPHARLISEWMELKAAPADRPPSPGPEASPRAA